ncbi:MAG: 1-acyl-sn-glycerol-3-phosphate acyltransferase [Burkholderiales bacterium]
MPEPLVRDGHARVGAAVLRALGWRMRLAQPVPDRCVIVVYPHTSNWDFVIGLAAKWYLGLAFTFLAKDSLFQGPFGVLLRRWGGLPIDRRSPHGVIGGLAQRFAQEATCRLVITPEGTRSRRPAWKSGFYHLARAANVPVGLGFIDYGLKEAGIGGYLDLTGDVEADMARIAAFYADKRGCRPELAGPVRLEHASQPGAESKPDAESVSDTS